MHASLERKVPGDPPGHWFARWAVRLTLVLSALLAAAPAAHAQNVLVQVVAGDSGVPLPGAVAHLVSADGDVLTSRLADRTGRVLFTGVAPGRYVVRAEMLGHSDGTSNAFNLAADRSVPLVLRLQPRPIALAGVEVTADAGPCEMRPGAEGRLLADIWDEARKALSAAAVAEEQGLYRYSLVLYEQDLDVDGAIVDDERTRQRGYMRTPFASRAVDELTEEGFVRQTPAEWTYYAPDAEALLSDRFLDTHCFRLTDGGSELVGLAFEPTGENEGVPDISGTLWLTRDSVQLRLLEFTYENLEPDVRPGDATGRIEFQRLPAGAWIVSEWWIRMPKVEVEALNRDRRRIVGFRRAGGHVDDVVEAGGRDLRQGTTTGAIEGIVVDSLGVPIQGVRVGWTGSSQRVFTNAEGRFGLVGLAEGTYRIAFDDPHLEAFGLAPPEVTQEVSPGVATSIELVMPSPAELVREACGPEATARTATLAGIVRDATGGDPFVGATVRARWSSIELNGRSNGAVGRETFTVTETTTDAYGVYRFCSVPRRESLTLTAEVAGVPGGEVTLYVRDDEEARMVTLSYSSAQTTDEPAEPATETPTLSTSPSVDARTTTGSVRDAETRAALENVLVELPELDVRVTSDADGRVSFVDLPPGEHALRAERLGYEVTEGTLRVPGTGAFAVLLEPLRTIGAQEPGTMVGRVTDERGQGVADADIRVEGRPSARTISNPRGRFRIDGLEPGVIEVSFDRLGHTSRTATFVIQAGRTAELAVVMPTEAIELEPIEVTVRAEALERNGFYDRRRQGFGHQFDRREIEDINAEIVYDIVNRAPGVVVTDPRRSDLSGRGATVGAPSYAINPRVPFSDDTPPRSQRAACYLAVFVDGIRMLDPDLQQISPASIEALEVYTGSTVPIEYRANRCGAILIWTRR
ncbi:MAG: carboxypeptidase regulatory-like domain-containing protein [Gemmatimonadota bacterium]